MLNKSLKIISTIFNFCLAAGAVFTSITILSGEGIFAEFPEEWAGHVPFNNWAGVAVFGMIIFGLGNGIAAFYGFSKNRNRLFVVTFIMGLVFLFCMVTQVILLDEWYLATVEFMIFSIIQIILGSMGLLTNRP